MTEPKKSPEETVVSVRLEALREAWHAAMVSASHVQRIYNSYLTRVDRSHAIPALEESIPVIRKLQTCLNELYDVTRSLHEEAPAKFTRGWWKGLLSVSGNRKELKQVFLPAWGQQKEWNATSVHLLNEMIDYLSNMTSQMRNFLEEQILFFQQITPWIDVKIEELRQEQNHNLAASLGKMGELFNALGSQRASILEEIVARFQSLESQLNEKNLASERRIQEMWFQINRQRASQPADLSDPDAAIRAMISTLGLTKQGRHRMVEHTNNGNVDRIKRYIPYFVTAPDPVLDIESGTGDFLQFMQQIGKTAYGLRPNQQDAEELMEKGFKAVSEDILSHLKQLKPHSIGSVFSALVMEHLPPEDLYEVLKRLQLVMKPHSVFLIETDNPPPFLSFHPVEFKESIQDFSLDPRTIAFFLRSAGFDNIQIHPIMAIPDNEELPEPIEVELLYPHLKYYIVGYRM